MRRVLVMLLLAMGSRLCPAGEITGVVVDPSHAVIPGAQVTLLRPPPALPITVRTDANGRYRFADVPHGVYDIQVAMHGFVTATHSLSLTGETINNDFELKVADMGEGPMVEEVQMAWVSATLLANGKPLARGKICFEPRQSRCATADENGNYSSWVSPGFVTIEVFDGDRLVSQWKTFLPPGEYRDQAELLGQLIPSHTRLMEASDVGRFKLPAAALPRPPRRRWF